MKSVVGQVGSSPLFGFFRSSLDLLLGVAFVGRLPTSRAASLPTDERRRRWQRSLPSLVSFEGSGFVDRLAERLDSYDYSRCRRNFSSCVVSSFHAF